MSAVSAVALPEEPKPAAAADAAPKKAKKIVRSQSRRAGVLMPVGRVARQMKKQHKVERISKEAAVFMAAVQEELARAILEYAVVEVKNEKVVRVTLRHITKVMEQHEELKPLLRGTIVAIGGVAPENKVEQEIVDMALEKKKKADKCKRKKIAKEKKEEAKIEAAAKLLADRKTKVRKLKRARLAKLAAEDAAKRKPKKAAAAAEAAPPKKRAPAKKAIDEDESEEEEDESEEEEKAPKKEAPKKKPAPAAAAPKKKRSKKEAAPVDAEIAAAEAEPKAPAAAEDESSEPAAKKAKASA